MWHIFLGGPQNKFSLKESEMNTDLPSKNILSRTPVGAKVLPPLFSYQTFLPSKFQVLSRNLDGHEKARQTFHTIVHS